MISGHPRNAVWAQSVVVLLMSALTVGTVALTAGIARAEETKVAAATVATTGTPGKISKELATQSALTALPGEVTDVTVERKHGKMVYVIEIVASKDGAETDVLVDMDSGKVLGMEH